MCIIPKQYGIKVNLKMLIKVFCPTTLMFPFLVFFSAAPPSKHHKQKHSSSLCGVCCTSETANSQLRTGDSTFPLAGIRSIRQHGNSYCLKAVWLWSTCVGCSARGPAAHAAAPAAWLVGCILHLSKVLVWLILLQRTSLSGLIMPFWDLNISTACWFLCIVYT